MSQMMTTFIPLNPEQYLELYLEVYHAVRQIYPLTNMREQQARLLYLSVCQAVGLLV